MGGVQTLHAGQDATVRGALTPLSLRITGGLFDIGNLVAGNRYRVGMLRPWHVWLGLATLALVILHVAAARYHHWVRRDGVLASILPGKRPLRD